MKKLLKDWSIRILLSSVAILSALFGVSELTNIHTMYLRTLSHWVVKLTNVEGTSGATGFIVKGASGQKYIMTNAHVCGLAEMGPILAEYGGERFQVEVYKKYVWNDLCAVRAHRPLGLAVNIASSVSLGEQAYVIGHPLLEPRSITVGELSGAVFSQVMTKPNPLPAECSGPTYQIIDVSNTMYAFFGITSVCVRTVEANVGTISILPGNSGSPTVNMWGSVIAVVFAGNEEGNRSYFVPLQDLKDFLLEL